MCLVAVDWVLNMLHMYVYLFSFKRLRDKHHRVLSLKRVHISLSPSFLKWHTYIIPCVFILLNKCFLNSKENHSYFTLSMLIYMLYINCIGYVPWYPCIYGPACVGISYKLLSNLLEKPSMLDIISLHAYNNMRTYHFDTSCIYLSADDVTITHV